MGLFRKDGPMQTMNVSLTPELARIVKDKVKSGLYGNASEVIREAVRRMDERGARDPVLSGWTDEALRKALEPGIKAVETGDFADYDLDDVKARLDARARARRKKPHEKVSSVDAGVEQAAGDW
jgi:antitoxin ParD1/3/4